MSKISKEQFLADVMHEINMLKQHGTAEEIAGLNLDTFWGHSQTSCIYGQMTGNCQSPRAKELMDSSCIRVMHLDASGTDSIDDVGIESEEFAINGEYSEQTWRNAGLQVRYYSVSERRN